MGGRELKAFGYEYFGFPVAVGRPSWTLCSIRNRGTDILPGIGIVYEHGPPVFIRWPYFFAHQADDSFQKGVPGADEGRDGLLIDFGLLKTNPPHTFSGSEPRCRSACPRSRTLSGTWGDLPTPSLPPFYLTAEMLERLDEEALNVMRLEPLCLSPFHFEGVISWTRAAGIVSFVRARR